jgi:hypothetical protein
MVGSQDGGAQEVVSLGVRRAADLRPTFLQVNDIADFGTLEEVAALLVPPRAKLLASSSAQHVAPSPTAAADEVPLDRTYYTYEFTRGALHGCLVAASKYGKVCARCDASVALRAWLAALGVLSPLWCVDAAAAPHRRTSCWRPTPRRSSMTRLLRGCARWRRRSVLSADAALSVAARWRGRASLLRRRVMKVITVRARSLRHVFPFRLLRMWWWTALCWCDASHCVTPCRRRCRRARG